MKRRLLQRLDPPAVPYGRLEVALMRLAFAVLVFYNLPVLEKFGAQPEPNGFAALFHIDFTWAGDPEVMGVLKTILVPVLVVYVIGWLPWLTTGYLFVLSLAVGTLKNSQGAISHVYQIITLILMVQWLWHLYLLTRRLVRKPHAFHHGWSAHGMEVFVSQSAIASIYLTTAISKLIRSDGQWLWQLRKIGVDLEKTWQQAYHNHLVHDASGWAIAIKQLVTDHPMMAVVLFGPGLFAELFAFVALYGRRWAFSLGVALVVLHLGAITVMKLHFEQNIYCLLIFFVNLPFLLLLAGRTIQNWSTGATRRGKRV